jgi:hypothetical protein
VGGTVPTVGRIKIARKASNFAVPANVGVYRRTIDTAETGANDVLLATTPGSEEGDRSKHVGWSPTDSSECRGAYRRPEVR